MMINPSNLEEKQGLTGSGTVDPVNLQRADGPED
jgi:hypothetical protein